MSAGGGNWENPGGSVSEDEALRVKALELAIALQPHYYVANIFDRADAFLWYFKTGQRVDGMGIIDPTPGPNPAHG